MNSCERFDSLIEAYLDGALSDEENKQFKEHISSCDACRRSLEVAKKMHDMLTSLDYEVEVPSDFCDKLHTKIEQLPKKKSLYTYTRHIGAIAACVVLAVVVAKNGVDTRLTKNADELTAEDTAGPVITGVMEEAEDEIVPPINTIKTTEDKDESVKQDVNVQRKTTETGKVIQQNKKAPEDKKAAAEIAVTPSPAPEVLNDIIKPQQTEEKEEEVFFTEKEASKEDLAGESRDATAAAATETTQALQTDTAEETLEPTAIPEAVTSSAQNAPASGGGGGGSSAAVYSAKRMRVLELKVDIENIEKAIDAASKYAPMQNGVYTMSAEKVKKLISELEAQGISVSFPEGIDNEEISFTVTAK